MFQCNKVGKCKGYGFTAENMKAEIDGYGYQVPTQHMRKNGRFQFCPLRPPRGICEATSQTPLVTLMGSQLM